MWWKKPMVLAGPSESGGPWNQWDYVFRCVDLDDLGSLFISKSIYCRLLWVRKWFSSEDSRETSVLIYCQIRSSTPRSPLPQKCHTMAHGFIRPVDKARGRESLLTRGTVMVLSDVMAARICSAVLLLVAQALHSPAEPGLTHIVSQAGHTHKIACFLMVQMKSDGPRSWSLANGAAWVT